MAAPEPWPLSPQKLADYQRDGCLLLEGLVPTPLLEELRAEADRLVALAATPDEQGRPRLEHDALFDFEESHSAELPRVRRVKEPQAHSEAFRRLTLLPELLSVCRQLLRSPSLRRGDMKLNVKSAEFGSPVQWHQDWAFYPHTNQDLLAVGFFLDDVTADNGPLVVLPGSHTGPVYSHHDKASGLFVGALDPEALPAGAAAAARPLLGRAGTVSFHHVRLVHGSALNRSAAARRIVFLEVAAADAWPLAGVSNFKDVGSFLGEQLLCGDATLAPRLEGLPVRMPLPKPSDPHLQGSIYALQQQLARPYFA